MGKLETVLTKSVDILAGITYLILIWGVFFNDEFVVEGGAEWVGVFLAFAFVAIIAKVIKVVLGTIGRAFDSTVGKVDEIMENKKSGN